MKRFSIPSLLLVCLLLAGCGGTQTASRSTAPDGAARLDDPSVVAAFGDQVLTLDEFENRYARSVGGRAAAMGDSLESYQEFLERYTNFRLKVLAAEEAGLARHPDILQEIHTYRTNLARPYLLEQEVLEPIIKDLYGRSQVMIDASHILVRVDADATPEDTLAAYERLSVLVDSLRQGADFAALARRHSEDPSARGADGSPGAAGHLGLFKSGRMVPEFEDAAYSTPPGDLSPIFRTRFGYHVLKVHDRQPLVPDVRIGHIMRVPRMQTAEDSAAVHALLDSLRARLLAGEDFATLARQHSEHLESAQRGGELGVLSYDQPMPGAPQFKEAAFSIPEEGGYSNVVVTQFGYHLIKLIDRIEAASYAEAYDQLKQMAARLPRAQAAERRFAARVRAERGVQVDSALVRTAFGAVAPDSLQGVLARQALPEADLSRPFATLGDSSYTFHDLLAFAPRAAIPAEPTTEARVLHLIDRFLDAKAIDYETAALEEHDQEFARIMEEFRDGLMLFRLMEDSVWNAASRDSAALEAFHAPRAAQYRFPDRTRLLAFYGPKDTLEVLAARLDAGRPAASLVAASSADSLQAFRVDTTYVSGKTDTVFDRALALEEGAHTGVLPYHREHVLLVRDGEEPARQKSFAEARAEVVSDYQQFLEARLLERLRQKYKVRTFPDRIARAFADEPQPPQTTTASVD